VRIHRVSPRALLVVGLAVALLALDACQPAGGGSPGAPAGSGASTGLVPPSSLTIFAAASLKAALEKVRSAYEAANPGTTLTISTDSSAALETQIEQGAPADVFLSADTTNPQKLVDAGLASGSIVTFAGNHLAVIVPTADPARISSPADLARPGVKVIAAGDSVPITKYANQLVANLAKLPGYPADFATAYAANVVSKEDDVAAVVTKIALGEGDAAIVYVTDAKTSGQVRVVPVPDAANVPAVYGGIVVKASAHQAAAASFLAWLAGPAGQGILASFGFLPVG
jgi:molybdate transport system substrate-binding protein